MVVECAKRLISHAFTVNNRFRCSQYSISVAAESASSNS